ncbi:MAG: hypothetical protein AAFU67_01905, partial [Bacteroidota bacterium]
PKTYDKKQLLEFTGSYYSQELATTYTFGIEEEHLVWSVQKDTIGYVRPIMQDQFKSDGGTNFTFVRNKKGVVEGFSLANVRLRGVRFDKQ